MGWKWTSLRHREGCASWEFVKGRRFPIEPLPDDFPDVIFPHDHDLHVPLFVPVPVLDLLIGRGCVDRCVRPLLLLHSVLCPRQC